LLVIEKKKDISILKAMGADENLIQRIFLYEGFLLSFVGCATGFLLAVAIIILQQKFQLIKITGGSFVVDAYPVEMQWPDFILVFCTVIAIGLFAAWIPARRAARTQYALIEE
jgi:lipoprotein-releasing system permease protein